MTDDSDAIIASTAPGANIVRLALGLPKAVPVATTSVFGPKALAKMGGNPHSGQKYESPVKKRPIDSDSDCELEII